MSTLPSTITQLAFVLLEQSLAGRVLVTFLIIVAGLAVAKTASRFIRYLWEARLEEEELAEKIQKRERSPGQLIEYLVVVVTLVVAMLYINAEAANRIVRMVAAYIPSVITAILVFLLGAILVKGVMNGIYIIVRNLELEKPVEDLGVSPRVVEGFLTGIKVFLYIVVLQIAITQLGVSTQLVSNTLTAASYGFVILIGLLVFFGFKDLVKNYAAGIYLRGSNVLKPGKRVRIGEETGEIRDISAFGTTITTDSGYFMLSPNTRLMDQEIMFKRVKADVETLEDIKNYFISQEPSYCGAASAEMALAMFGFDITQGDLAEESGTEQPGGVHPDPLIDAVEDLTNREVRAAWVDYSHITDLADECKTWFNDGGLIIANFAKPILFPDADTAHYSLAVGVEGSELLMVDPSADTVSGGVYYVEASEMLEAMQEWEGRERGYIVLAPKGTTAYWRIKEELLYANKNLYDHLSKSLELQLGRILRRGKIMKHVMPDAVEEFLDTWRRDDKVKRLWKPEDRGGQQGEKKLDEFTGSRE